MSAGRTAPCQTSPQPHVVCAHTFCFSNHLSEMTFDTDIFFIYDIFQHLLLFFPCFLRRVR